MISEETKKENKTEKKMKKEKKGLYQVEVYLR